MRRTGSVMMNPARLLLPLLLMMIMSFVIVIQQVASSAAVYDIDSIRRGGGHIGFIGAPVVRDIGTQQELAAALARRIASSPSSRSNSNSRVYMISNNNNDRGDFDDAEEGGLGAPSPPSDMLARIFQGAQQRRANSGELGDWARYSSALRGGVVLVANPAVFLKTPPADLSRRFFLPNDLASEFMEFGKGQNAIDNLANILPVVLLLGSGPNGTSGLVLNRRTGYLVGDLNVDSSGFKVQPVHLGGMAESDGVYMLHTYPDLPRTQQVTDDGLCFGGNYTAAQEMVRDKKASSARFKFFIQQTLWTPGQLRQEIEELKVWYPAQVCKDVLLKNRGREGPKMVKPLWTEVMELMGGSFKEMKESLYNGEEDFFGK